MENKSVQDILDVDVEAIVDQGKKAKKRRKQMLIKEGIAGIVLLCSIFWFAQTRNIREVEEAIENIEIENLSSITHAGELYDALNDIMKWRVSNREKLLKVYYFNEIVQAWDSPTMQGVPKIKQMLENLDSSTKNTLKEMLIESNRMPKNTVLDIFES